MHRQVDEKGRERTMQHHEIVPSMQRVKRPHLCMCISCSFMFSAGFFASGEMNFTS